MTVLPFVLNRSDSAVHPDLGAFRDLGDLVQAIAKDRTPGGDFGTILATQFSTVIATSVPAAQIDAVPEPSTLLLIGLTLAGLAVFCQRCNTQRR